MIKLEVKYYSRAEIADIIGVDSSDKHFARKIKDTLTNWGYTFIYSRKGVTIEKQPTTIEERIAEIAIRELDLDVRVNPAEFATFLYLLTFDGDFQCCTWGERVKMMEVYKIKTCEKTLRNWCKKLYELNIIKKDLSDVNRVLWITISYNGQREQKPVDDEYDWKAYEYYCKKRQEILDAEMAKHGDRKLAWKNVFPQLWEKFHCVYYYCKPIDMNGIITKEMKELFELVEQYITGIDFTTDEDNEEATVRIEPLTYKKQKTLDELMAEIADKNKNSDNFIF